MEEKMPGTARKNGTASDETLKMVSIRFTPAQIDALNALSELTGDSVNLIVRKSVDLYIRNFMAGQAAEEAARRTERALQVLSAAAGGNR
jgi:predicted DNA-binding protein